MKMVGEEPKGRVQVGNTLALRLSSKPGMSFYDYALWFFFVCVRVCMHIQLLQSFPTLCDPMDCSPPGSSVHGILQARILEWVAISFSILVCEMSAIMW